MSWAPFSFSRHAQLQQLALDGVAIVVATQPLGLDLPELPVLLLFAAKLGPQQRQAVQLHRQIALTEDSIEHLQIVEFAELVLGLAQFGDPRFQGA